MIPLKQTASLKIEWQDALGGECLVLTGDVLADWAASLTFTRQEKRLSFDAAQLYGSWSYGGPSYLPSFPAASYAIHGAKALESFQLAPTHLSIREDKITFIDAYDTLKSSSHPFSTKKSRALDITDFTVKDGGLFLWLNELEVKLYLDSQGYLRAVPIMTPEIADGARSYILNSGTSIEYIIPTPELQTLFYQSANPFSGNEAAAYHPMRMDIYGENPQAAPGQYYIARQYETEDKLLKSNKKKIAAILKEIQPIVIGENNAVTLSIGKKEYTGTLTYPDPYTVKDKQEYAAFSCKHNGYTLALNVSHGREDVFFLLRVYKDKKLVTSFTLEPLTGEGGLAGAYFSDQYPVMLDEERLAFEEGLSTLTIDENLLLTRVQGGETLSGQLAFTGDLAGVTHLTVTLGDTTYALRPEASGRLSLSTFRQEGEDIYYDPGTDYFPADPELATLLADDSFQVFRSGYSISWYGEGTAEGSEIVFNTFGDGKLLVSPQWDRVYFCQNQLRYPDMTPPRMLYQQERLYEEIPVLEADVTSSTKTLRLDFDGVEAVFTHTPSGETKLAVGDYHLIFQPAE